MAIAVALAGFSLPAQSQSKITTPAVTTKPTADTAKPKKLSITDKVKSSKKTEGMFTIYQDTATGSVAADEVKNGHWGTGVQVVGKG